MTALEKAVDTFKRTFMTSEGHARQGRAGGGAAEEDIQVAQVTRQVRG